MEDGGFRDDRRSRGNPQSSILHPQSTKKASRRREAFTHRDERAGYFLAGAAAGAAVPAASLKRLITVSVISTASDA
jgi:hypothetical protein